MKGSFAQISDTPEMERARTNQRNISSVSGNTRTQHNNLYPWDCVVLREREGVEEEKLCGCIFIP